MNKVRVIIGSSLLAALSIVFQFSPLFFPFEFIRIDLVGMPWILASLAFGPFGGVLSACVSSVLISFTDTGIIGASMKLVATLPIVLLAGLLKRFKKTSIPWLVAAFFAATIARVLITLAINIFWAIPAFFGLNFEQALAFAPVIIAGNVLAALIEFAVAAGIFISALRSRLAHYLD